MWLFRTPLTRREIEYLELAAQGFTDREIAIRLEVARATVRNTLVVIRNKLNARNTTHAVALWLRSEHPKQT